MSNYFGGKNPFDHPFFTQPFGGIFGGKNPFDDPFFTRPFGDHTGSRKHITIEELNPDDDGGNDAWENHMPGKEISMIGPSDEYLTENQSFSFQKISYGGLNEPHYTSSVGKRMGGDEMVLMEIKEEDRLAGESLHTISKGIHDKGHSVTKKKSSEGHVDTLQTLHNLNEDELAGFEESWKDNADKVLPGWGNGFNSLKGAGSCESDWGSLSNWNDWVGWPFPSLEHYGSGGAISSDGANDITNWGGWGRWPFPALEHHAQGVTEMHGEPSGSSTQGASRRVIPID